MPRGRFDRGHAVGGCSGGTSRVSAGHCFVDGVNVSHAPLPGYVSTVPELVASLLIFGAGVGSLDVSMNIQAVIVERASGQTMMSGFHGLFSLGGIAGAAGITFLLGAGASPLIAVWCVVAGIAVALTLSISRLLPYGSKSDGPAFAIPHGIVLFIGALCFIVFLTEGALLDWSAYS